MIDLEFYTREFRSNSETFEKLLSHINEKQIRWKQDRGKWNLLEIVCHLVDEEREDFRTRLKLVLENPVTPFPSIDPVGWVTLRKYAEQNFKNILQKFILERNHSIEWLTSLSSQKWDNTYVHPTIGPMSAKFILSNWLAHDYLHIRQIIKLKYDYLKEISSQDLNYAGNW